MMSTGMVPRAVAQWAMSESLLGQFSLAKEQRVWVEGMEKVNGDEDEDEDEDEEALERD